MTRPHARAGSHYVPPMPIDFAGDEPTNSVVEEEFEQFANAGLGAWIVNPLIALVLIVACVGAGLIAASYFI